MSNVSQRSSSQLSKSPPKLSNKQVLLKNNHNKPTKRSGKSPRNKNNNMLNYNNTSFAVNNNGNNKPLRVVHISNPMRFQATAAEFRSLVQELTGRDAVVDDDDDIHHRHHFCGTPHLTAAEEADGDDESSDVHLHHHVSVNNDSSSNDDDDKVLLHHHDDTEHHQHRQAEVNLAACFGPPSDLMMSFDYYGGFSGDLVGMEDLRAFMADDIHY